ncbi:MAG: hypothetical protein GY820_39560 [Gammaproteobacteria bacterium]|nr:hypothetical protein [Gammaproteobacteria bacterium]
MAKSRLQNEALIPGVTVPQYRYKYVTFKDMQGWSTDPAISAGAGAMIYGVTGTSLVCALRPQAAADSHTAFFGLDSDVDVERDIDLKIIWSCDQAAADAYTWTITHGEYLIETDDIDVAPATALDTPLVEDTDTATASILKNTPWGTIAGGTLNGNIADGYMHGFKFVATTNGGTEATDLLLWHGFVIRYQPKTF